jgi:hypothetical protein
VNRLEFPPSHQVCGDPYGIHRSKACQKRQAKSPVKSIAAVAQQWLEAVVLRLANRLRTGRSGPCDSVIFRSRQGSLLITVFGRQKILDFVWIATGLTS